MATILPAIRAAESRARLARRIAALATGMAGTLDMGAQLARYRNHLVHSLWAFKTRSLEEDWARLERDAAQVDRPIGQDRGDPVPSR